MKNLKNIIDIFKRVLPSNINFKRIYIMGAIHALAEIVVLFIFTYFGVDKAFKEKDINLFLITIIVIIFTSLIKIIVIFVFICNITCRL